MLWLHFVPLSSSNVSRCRCLCSCTPLLVLRLRVHCINFPARSLISSATCNLPANSQLCSISQILEDNIPPVVCWTTSRPLLEKFYTLSCPLGRRYSMIDFSTTTTPLSLTRLSSYGCTTRRRRRRRRSFFSHCFLFFFFFSLHHRLLLL